MINKYGKVIITDENIEINGFEFDGNIYSQYNASAEALLFAKERIEKALEKI